MSHTWIRGVGCVIRFLWRAEKYSFVNIKKKTNSVLSNFTITTLPYTKLVFKTQGLPSLTRMLFAILAYILYMCIYKSSTVTRCLCSTFPIASYFIHRTYAIRFKFNMLTCIESFKESVPYKTKIEKPNFLKEIT